MSLKAQLFLLFWIPALAYGQPPVFTSFEWGEDFYHKEKWEKAEKLFLEITETENVRDPIIASSFYYLSEIYDHLGKDSLSVECKKKLVRTGYDNTSVTEVYLFEDGTDFVFQPSIFIFLRDGYAITLPNAGNTAQHFFTCG